MRANTHPSIVALTGGTGFLGANLIDHLIHEGFHIRALARKPSTRKPVDSVKENQLTIIEGSLHDQKALNTLITGADFIIHCAGLTHARRRLDFFTVNVDGTKNLAKAVCNHSSTAKPRFIHISSLAASQPHLSAYAMSKSDSEGVITRTLPSSDWTILRAPALFGPRDQATLPFFKAVKRGFAPIPAGKSPCHASILHVDDFCRAIINTMTDAPPSQIYEVNDSKEGGHSWQEIAAACAAAQNIKAKVIKLPKPVLWSWASLSSAVIKSTGKAPMVTPDKVSEFFHPDWAAKTNLLSQHTNWTPQISLEEGFSQTAQWYRKNKLL